jgi:hypothetical protein
MGDESRRDKADGGEREISQISNRCLLPPKAHQGLKYVRNENSAQVYSLMRVVTICRAAGCVMSDFFLDDCVGVFRPNGVRLHEYACSYRAACEIFQKVRRLRRHAGPSSA